MHMVHWYLVHTSLKCVDTHHNKASTSTLRIQSRFQHFNPLLGTSDSPANYASRNPKMVEFDLLYIYTCRLKMSGII
jgi:hypothetical protein